jgi:hypothetical protein
MPTARLKIPAARLVGYSFNTDANPTELHPSVTSTTLTPAIGMSLWQPANSPSPLYYTDPVLRVSPDNGITTAALAVANDAYFEFTVTAVSGQFIPLMIAFVAARGGGGTRGVVVRSDDDGYTADLLSTNLSTQRPTWSVFQIVLSYAAKSSLAFRIYVYTGSSSNSIEFDDIVLYGRPI